MILLILSLVIVSCTLLIFFRLSSPLLWKISLACTEYGHLFFFLPLLVAAAAGTGTPASLITVFLSFCSAALLLAPSFFASALAHSLPQRLTAAFGPMEPVQEHVHPFRWSELWFGSHPLPVQKEVLSYAVHDGIELRLNFYRALTSSSAPCVIVIHTGGWDSGSPDEFEPMNRHLASVGYAVAAISYRFAPAFPWPAQREDVLAAISYLKDNAAALGVASQQFVLFGRSAGGQIAETVACSANDPAIKGCIGFYAPADLIFAYEHLSEEPDILDSRTLLHNFLGGPLSDKFSLYNDASSYHHAGKLTPPTLLIHGVRDPLTWYRQSERLSARLTELSVPNLSLELPWATHAFDYNFNGPGGQVSRYAVEYFLSAVTKSYKKTVLS